MTKWFINISSSCRDIGLIVNGLLVRIILSGKSCIQKLRNLEVIVTIVSKSSDISPFSQNKLEKFYGVQFFKEEIIQGKENIKDRKPTGYDEAVGEMDV